MLDGADTYYDNARRGFQHDTGGTGVAPTKGLEPQIAGTFKRSPARETVHSAHIITFAENANVDARGGSWPPVTFTALLIPTNFLNENVFLYEANPVTCSAFLTPPSTARRSRYIPMFFFLLMAVCASVSAQAPKAKPAPCSLTDAEIAGLSGDASTDIHALSNYSETAYGLLKAGKFDQLDCVADMVRSRKETFAGGMWKIHTIYTGLATPPLHPTQEDWATHIALLQQWVLARPKSVTARIALGEAYVNYGADARGHGFADTVSESGWKLLAERTAKAKQILDEASALPAKDPEWYFAMQTVALGNWEPAARRTLFEQAVKTEAGYYYYYRAYANSILPQWGGEDGEVGRFLQEIADKSGGDAGNILYFRVAANMVCGCRNDRRLNLSWARIKKGFDAVEEQSGPAPENWNLMAHAAITFGNADVADKLFSRIGDQWSENIWGNSSTYESAKQWAKQLGPLMALQHAAEGPAEAHLQTPEGKLYQTAFEEKLRTWLQPCTQESADGDPGQYELLVKIDKDGRVVDRRGMGASRVGFCLSSKLSEFWQSKQPVFPPPPEADYWVRFDLQPQDPPAAASK